MTKSAKKTFSSRVKILAVKRYLEKKETTKDIMKRYNVSLDTLRRWIKLYKYNGEKAFDKKNKRRFEESFKREIVESIVSKKTSLNVVSYKNNIDRSVIREWVKKYSK